MTNVCNIFKPLTNDNGNFLLFSSYIKDLTQYAANSGHKVSPSNFVCLDLDDNVLNKLSSELQSITTATYQSANYYFPAYFQNVLENGSVVEAEDFNNKTFSGDFWYLMSKICIASNNTDTNIQSKIRYAGKIDSTSWEDGYFDTILNINSGAEQQVYKFADGVIPESATGATPANVLSFLAVTSTNEKSYNQKSYIEGWEAADNIPVSGGLVENYTISYPKVPIDPTESVFEYLFEIDNTSTPTNAFTFNTILVTYDILDANNQTIEHDIPMGIYFTGTVDNSGCFTNPVTIYTTSPDAYGAGTSWSLRIATRFSVDPAGTLKVTDVALSSQGLYDSISAQLTAVADLLKEVQDSFKETNKINTNLKNTLIQFFNTQKVNVPYIKDGYWFVNGVSTGAPAYEPLPDNWFENYQATDSETLAVFDE